MTSYTVQAAKTHLSRILGEVENGDEIVICRGPIPIARLVPFERPRERRFGIMDFEVPDDFDAALSAEELSAWE